MTREIELYGRLKDAGLGDRLRLALAPGATAAQALKLLAKAFGAKGHLLDGCVLATESAVLKPEETVPEGAGLAVLPPVCGG